MDTQGDVRQFLASRRARFTPDQAGLPSFGGTRRVPGLRRAEVALMAGITCGYYTRLERGNLSGVSDSVLDAVAGALHLDDAERCHLYNLARTAGAKPRPRRRRRWRPCRSSPTSGTPIPRSPPGCAVSTRSTSRSWEPVTATPAIGPR
jgi:transcriptional regulator with XRE-family HTH domain